MHPESFPRGAQRQRRQTGRCRRPLRHKLTALLAAALLGGCASVQHPNPADPWEGMNRSIYTFNDAVDRALLKPVTLMFQDLTPQPVHTCIGNIFSNIGDLWSATNSLLQGQGHDFINTLGRFLFNSTMGLGGCIDVASMNGAPRIESDFGVTLGVWGVDSGPYLVLPFLGSSTLRDGAATVGLMAASASPTQPIMEIDDVAWRNVILGIRVVDARANLLPAERLVDAIALDRYSFVRDAYLQQRANWVQRGTTADALPDYEDDEDEDANDARGGGQH